MIEKIRRRMGYRKMSKITCVFAAGTLTPSVFTLEVHLFNHEVALLALCCGLFLNQTVLTTELLIT